MIQDYLSFAGAFLAALIGAWVLIHIARSTAEKVQENYKADKLAEAKRDIFLGLVDSWMNYLLVINSFRIYDLEEYGKIVLQANKDLVSSLHKASFISKPETKKEVMLFTFDFSRKNIEISKIIRNWYQSQEADLPELFQILEDLGYQSLDLQNLLRTELGITNNPQIDSFLLDKQKEFFSEIKKILFGAE